MNQELFDVFNFLKSEATDVLTFLCIYGDLLALNWFIYNLLDFDLFLSFFNQIFGIKHFVVK